jgi:Anti-sigma-K factor rskA
MWLTARFKRDPEPPCDEHDEVESTIAAYVMDVAEWREANAAAAHLEVCASCRELARRLSRAASAIPLAAEEVRPPDRLRASILGAAAPTPGTPRASVELPGGRLKQRHQGRGPGRRYLIPALAAGLLLLAVAAAGLTGWDMNLTRELARQTTISRQLAERNTQLSRVNDALNQGPQYHTLSGEGPLGSARGSIVAFKEQPVTVIYFSGLPQAGRGKVYELWLTDAAGQRTRGPVFTPDGSGTARVWLDRNLNGITKLGVTAEQGPNGVDAPTQQSQLKTQLG